MLNIYEVMINMCDFHGTEDFEKVLKLRSLEAWQICGKRPDGVYFGFEFCENMLFHCSVESLKENMYGTHEAGYRNVFVIPPLHERYIPEYQSFLEEVLFYDYTDECVVNDIGTLIWVRKKLGWGGPVIFGRLWDKAVREQRMNLEEIQEIPVNAREFFKPSVCNEFTKRLAEKFEVKAFETDTLPNGKLHVTKWEKDYCVHIHYPRILLSRPAYCEFEGIGKSSDEKFFFRRGCSGLCKAYVKKIGEATDKCPIYKQGLSLIGFQEKAPEEAIEGRVRLIYSGRQKNE